MSLYTRNKKDLLTLIKGNYKKLTDTTPKDEIIKSFPLKLESTQMLIIISTKYCIGGFGRRQEN